jgi:epsilon-lactone hydrolase
MTTEEFVLHVPARDIPVPTSISEAARAVLAQGPIESRDLPWPPLDDREAWRKRIAWQDEQVLAMIGDTRDDDVDTQERRVEGVRVFVVTPDGARPDRVYLDIHGGGFILGGGDLCRAVAVLSARKYGVTTWSVDYRMPPDDPYPAPLDDCVAAYRGLLREHGPEQVIVGGYSAGANLAAALILRSRDEGLPLPAAALLPSPGLDLTGSGDTFKTNLGVDTVIGGAAPLDLLYAAGHDPAHPYISPLFGDFTKGFPPTLLTAGTRDLLLSNAVRMHRALRRAGVTAELHILEAAPHGGFFGTAPEEDEIDAEIRRFCEEHWPR